MIQEPHSHISIKGSDLVSAYGVYIILIKDGSITYYYVGQTGDAKYISARSPFYRLAAHLGYGKSTQNQVYEGLKKALTLKSGILRNERENLEKWLADKTVDKHFFKTDDFEFMEDVPGNRQTHIYKRERTLKLETAILKQLKSRCNLVQLNKSETTHKSFEEAIPRAKEIIENLGL